MKDPTSRMTWVEWTIVGLAVAGIALVVLAARSCGL